MEEETKKGDIEEQKSDDHIVIEVEKKPIDTNTMRSCCYDLDKSAVQYFTQVGVIIGIMSFCVYKLSMNETPEQQTIYMSLLSSLVGLVLPSPIFKKK
jgi:hypothetical protein